MSFFDGRGMRLYGELKSYKAKALISGDKGIELKFYILANSGVDVSEIHAFLLQPLELELKNADRDNKADKREAPIPELSGL